MYGRETAGIEVRMRERLLFIYNPNAGTGKIRGKLSEIIEIFSNAGYEIIIYPTKCRMDARRCAMEYAEGGLCDRIVCAGGDGTLNEVAGGMMLCGKKIPIGYIPTGTTNDFGHSLKIPKNLTAAAEIAAAGAIFQCDIGSINGTYFTYTAAFGLFSDVSYETPQNMKNVLGRAAYLLSGISKLAGIRPFTIRAEYDGQIIEGEFILGMLANSDSIGGFRGLTGKDIMFDDGLFEMLLIKMPRNILDLNGIIYELLSGGLNNRYIHYERVSKVHITSLEELPWSLDGEDGGNIQDARIVIHCQAICYVCRKHNHMLPEIELRKEEQAQERLELEEFQKEQKLLLIEEQRKAELELQAQKPLPEPEGSEQRQQPEELTEQ